MMNEPLTVGHVVIFAVGLIVGRLLWWFWCHLWDIFEPKPKPTRSLPVTDTLGFAAGDSISILSRKNDGTFNIDEKVIKTIVSDNEMELK